MTLDKALKGAFTAACRDLAREMGPAPTADIIEERLTEATWTLARLPDRELAMVRGGNSWPEYRLEHDKDYKEELTPLQQRLRTVPTSGEIDRMQPSLDLLQHIAEDQIRRIVFWACSSRFGEMMTKSGQPNYPLWEMVAQRLNLDMSERTIRRRYRQGLDLIVEGERLNRGIVDLPSTDRSNTVDKINSLIRKYGRKR